MKFVSLKYKLILISLIISVILTGCISLFEVKHDIDAHIHLVEAEFTRFKQQRVDFIAAKMWSMDYESLQATAQNYLNNSIIDRIFIADIDGKTIFFEGGLEKDSVVTDTFSVTRYHNGAELQIGNVTVSANIPTMIESLRQRMVSLLFINGFVISLVFFISYLFLHRTVLRDLEKVIRYAHDIDLSGKEKHIPPPDIEKRFADEISLLAESIQGMAQRISSEFDRRTTAEEEVRQSEYRHRIIFENSPLGLIRMDHEGIIRDCNEKFVELMGADKEALIGFNGAKKSTPAMREAIHQALSGKVSVFEDEYTSITGKKTTSLRVVYNPVTPKETSTDIIATLEDISDRKRAEEEKVTLEKQLQQARKMEAIGTLAGGIAHDFNNILSAILGYAELAKEDTPPESPVAEDLSKVLEAGHRAKELVKQILAFSRQAETHKIPVKLPSLVEEVVKILRPSLPTTIEIVLKIETKDAVIYADPIQIHQILLNLSTNAMHAMEDGGMLEVELRTVSLGPQDLTNEPDLEPGDYVELRVSDTGCGIAPEIREKIFDPYFTTKPTGGGTGMGLSIVHGIVKSYSGFISCTSTIGKGTVFNIFLPRVSGDVASITEAPDHMPEGREKILFIDDEELLADMGKDMLERLGYSVTVRKSSLEALATFTNSPDHFDLIITDQTMPAMTGADIARRMLQIRPEIPIILCTGYSATFSEEKAKSLGIKGYALKPLTKGKMARLIRQVLDQDEASADIS